MRVASHLSTDQVDRIVWLIDSWPAGTRITWKAIVEVVAARFGIRPSRQTLGRHGSIRIAYQTRKMALRRGEDSDVTRRVSDQRLRRLTARLERLEHENELLRQRFARWQYNSWKYGLDESVLDESMPVVDRGRTD